MADEPGSEERVDQLEEDEGGPVKSFLEHLEDLRWVLIKSLVALGLGVLICLIGGNYVVAILKRPLLLSSVQLAQIIYAGVHCRPHPGANKSWEHGHDRNDHRSSSK